jgi:predicted AlkP superfamily pyrophosphatase or phosphodiesterase
MKKLLILTAIFILVSFTVAFCEPVHVIVNIWDGTERAKMRPLFYQGLLPNLKSLGPLYYLRSDMNCFDKGCMLSVTKSQHATMFTGCSANVHGVFSNKIYKRIPDNITVQELIKLNNPAVKVAQISGKKEHFGHKTFGGIMNDVDLYMQYDRNPDFFMPTVLKLIQDWQKFDYFIVLHFRMPDVAGHAHGVDSTEYSNEIKNNDTYLGEILAAIENNKNGAKSILYVLSDHGFGCPTPTSHDCAPYTFIVSNDPALVGGLIMRSVAELFLNHFGLRPFCE